MNEVIYFVEKDGHRRKGEKSKCGSCGNEFIRRLRPYPGREKKKYCSTACSQKSKLNRVTVKCETCQKEIERKKSQLKSSRHGVFFCGRKCKDFAQSIEGDCKIIQPSHYNGGISVYRKLCRKEIDQGCACGEKKRYQITVHHKDGDRTNNKKTNLEVVCWRCHIVRHLKLTNGEWVFLPSALTSRSKIKELT